MVCIPCVIVPVLLLIFRFIIKPILMKFWYKTRNDGEKNNVRELIKECKNGTCYLAWKTEEKDLGEKVDKVEKVEKVD